MTPTGDTKPKLLFYEPGASWYWVLTGPLAAVSVLLLEISSGAGVGLITPAIFLVMVSAFVALQVKAARIHTSVELTHDALRQGTETIRLAEIVKIYPEADGRETSGEEPAKWQSARTLGELVAAELVGRHALVTYLATLRAYAAHLPREAAPMWSARCPHPVLPPFPTVLKQVLRPLDRLFVAIFADRGCHGPVLFRHP